MQVVAEPVSEGVYLRSKGILEAMIAEKAYVAYDNQHVCVVLGRGLGNTRRRREIEAFSAYLHPP